MKAQDVKQSISPASFYRYELPNAPEFKRSHGWVDGGLCPFHDDQHLGSFRVNLDTGQFCCFSCGASGPDVISFTMRRTGLTFPEALTQLGREWGLS